MSNVSPPLLPTPFLTQRPEVFFYSKSDHVSPLLRALCGLLSYRKSQSHCGLKVLNYLQHPPSPFICLTSPILYSPQCCSHNGLPTIPKKLTSMLLLCCSLCLEYSPHRYLPGSLPQPPSGVYLNECFILLFFENSRVRYFLIHTDHLSWHIPFLFPNIPALFLWCISSLSSLVDSAPSKVSCGLAALIFAIFILVFL